MKQIKPTIYYLRSEQDLDMLYKIHYKSLKDEIEKDKKFKKKDFQAGLYSLILKDINEIRKFCRALERTAIKPQIKLAYIEMLEKIFPNANFKSNKFGLNYINNEIKNSSQELKDLNYILEGICHVISINKFELEDEQMLIVYTIWILMQQLVGNVKIKFKDNMQKITYCMQDISYSSKFDIKIDLLTSYLLDIILTSCIKADFKEFYNRSNNNGNYIMKLIKEREGEKDA